MTHNANNTYFIAIIIVYVFYKQIKFLTIEHIKQYQRKRDNREREIFDFVRRWSFNDETTHQ